MNAQTARLRPTSLWASLIYFGVPALLMAGGFYILMPYLLGLGIAPYYAYSIALGLPLLVMLIASLIAYRLEGRPMRWRPFVRRLRYERMTLRDWLWTAGIFVAPALLNRQFARLTKLAIDRGTIPLPDAIPAFVDPRTVFSVPTLDTAVGGLRRNWTVLAVTVVLLVVNVLGEEFWWRGVIYPRQELALGRWTWLVHALLWDLFHA
jgi:membrane protease YdiL (CAAX protease family)